MQPKKARQINLQQSTKVRSENHSVAKTKWKYVPREEATDSKSYEGQERS